MASFGASRFQASEQTLVLHGLGLEWNGGLDRAAGLEEMLDWRGWPR
jgi:hypothetical protein